MSTALDLIKIALRKLDVTQFNQTPDADEGLIGLSALNLMLDQWTNEKLMIFAWKNETFDLTPTKGEYTIGPTGADLTTTRPMYIERAFVRFNYGTQSYVQDFQLEIIPNSKYQELYLKSLTTTYPAYLYYNPTYPNGTIELYPLPSSACKLGLSSTLQLTKFDKLTDEVDLPPGYESAIAFNLAVEICPDFGDEQEPWAA
jgi:hypothetical protein